MPLTVSSLLENKTVSFALRYESAALGMGNANHAIGHASALDVLAEHAPNLIDLFSQTRHVVNWNVRLAIQNHRVCPVGEVHRHGAGNPDLLARWQGGERRGWARASCAAKTNHGQSDKEVARRKQHNKINATNSGHRI